MTRKPREVRAWFGVTPRGLILEWSGRRSRYQVAEFLEDTEGELWTSLQRAGYRIVRVRIIEDKP